MSAIITTSRLEIREFTDSINDIEFVLKLLNTDGWLAYIGDRNIRTFEDGQQYVAERFTSKYGTTPFIMYAVDLKPTHTTIGMCGLVKRDFLDDPDVGYALLPEFEGNGYASEAVTAILKYATETLGYEKVMAIVTPENVRSISLLEKLGFEFLETKTQNGDAVKVFEKRKAH